MPCAESPSATIDLGYTTLTVTFDLATLEQIEERMGKGVNEILFGEFGGWLGGTDASGGADPQLTDDERAARLVRRMRAGFVRRFIAACIGAESVATLPLGRVVKDVFTPLAAAFVAAVVELNGGAEGGAAANPPGPAGSGDSGPGPVSSSESDEPSSTG